MNNISTDIPSENTTVDDSESTLLPRSPWNSKIAYLRVLFRAKKALDRIEKEAGILRIEN
ncbi:hypothetical protein [Nostoc sp.]|uniref:hypothetical protein n=1 Tax=Nostoc sp. TaxID=1180 RepID=UPI002FFC37D7